MSVFFAAVGLSGCVSTSDVSTLKLLPAINDKVVFFVGTGNGSKTVLLKRIYLGAENPKDIPGGLLAIVANCSGGGSLLVRVEPGGEADNPTCNGPGGGGSMETLPATQPWPTEIVISASQATKWSVAVVDPQGSAGVAEPQ